jgi:hypothetical protein
MVKKIKLTDIIKNHITNDGTAMGLNNLVDKVLEILDILAPISMNGV